MEKSQQQDESQTETAKNVRTERTHAIKSDRHIYADGLGIKTTILNAIRTNLTAFGEVGTKYHIKINRGEIVILARRKIKRPENCKKRLRKKYQGVEIQTRGNILGQEI